MSPVVTYRVPAATVAARMFLALLAVPLALQAGDPPPWPRLSSAQAAALADSLEAQELRFFRHWNDAWRESEARRHALLQSEAVVSERNRNLHCHPGPAGVTSVYGVITAGPAGTNASASYRAMRAPGSPSLMGTAATMVKDPDSQYAVCPTWVLNGNPPASEASGVDHALTDALRELISAQRAILIASFDSAAALLPTSDWMLGQRVRLLADQGDLERALSIARSCGATRWWCEALSGFALMARREPVAAEVVFDSALVAMPAATRCKWTNVTELIDLRERQPYEAMSCARRDSVNTKFWWLADPMYFEPGNERRAEHFARHVLVALHSALDRDERFDWRVGAGFNPLSRMIERYGWPSYTWWGGEHNEQSHSGYLSSYLTGLNETYTTFEYSFGRMHTVPAWHAIADPMHAVNTDWSISKPDTLRDAEWWPREHFAPRTPILQLPSGQQAFLRRQDHVLFATAADVEPVAFGVNPNAPMDVTLVTTDRPGSFRVAARDHTTFKSPLVVRADVPSQPTLVSVEFPGDTTTRQSGGRSRFSIAPPPTLAALKPGQKAISDPVILAAPSGGAALPNGVDAALARMAGSTRVPAAGKFGVYWETYGFLPTDSVNVAVWIERYTPQGIVRRFGIVLNVATDLNTPISISWSEPQSDRVATLIAGPVPILSRSVVVDVNALPTGDYWLDVAVARRGEQPVRGRRGFSIR